MHGGSVPGGCRLTDVLLLKDIHQNLILLSQNKKISLMSYGAHFHRTD